MTRHVFNRCYFHAILLLLCRLDSIAALTMFLFDHLNLLAPMLKHPYFFLVEAICVAMATWHLIHRRSRLNSRNVKLTEKEAEDLITEWQPEPLVEPVDPNHHSLRPRLVSSMFGHMITVDGKECLNLATHNYLGLVENEECLQMALDTVDRFGVGSCGPRGFFGTSDVHLELEKEIARFLNTEEVVLYSYGYSAISSAIPAYAKVGDVIFADDGVNFSIQQGLMASRSTVHYFKHNDVNHLATLLDELSKFDYENPKIGANRARFIVVEGLYINHGDLCSLPEIVALKHKYKCRLFLEDSCAFGVLGSGGRGTIDHYSLDISNDIDLVSVSLEYASAAYGGFCAGTHYIVDHQRLSGLGYCFSASQPPLQAAVGIRSIQIIKREPERISQLRANCIRMHQLITEQAFNFILQSDPISPVKHIRFSIPIETAIAVRQDPSEEVKENNRDFYHKQRTVREFDIYRLEKVVEVAHQNGYALTVARYLEHNEHLCPEPSIRITVNVSMTEEEISQSVQVIDEAFALVQSEFVDGLF